MSLLNDIHTGIKCDTGSKPHSVVGRTVCVAAHPGKMALFPFVAWFEKHYKGKYRFAKWVFGTDLLLLGLAIGLACAAVILWLWQPPSISDQIVFEATVAPHEIVSGSSSTLVIRYTNTSEETLEHVRVNLGFPDHFLVQEVTDEGHFVHPDNRTVDVGTLPPNEAGSVKIRGVMFGDVGGTQVFTSTMTFSYPTDAGTQTGRKAARHAFTPVRSTLALALTLPDKLLSYQPIEGKITYRNTGEIDFPEISVEPAWPDGFTLSSSDVPLKNNVFTLPAIAAGEEGTLAFTGRLGEASGDVPFVFHPSFTFGDIRYSQETLSHVATIMPLPLQVSHSVEADTVRPGGSAKITLTYTNVGEETVTNVRVGVSSDSPFAKRANMTVGAAEYPELARVEPGQSGTIAILFPLASSIAQSATKVYEQIPFTTWATAEFDAFGTTGLASRAASITYTMTSPIVLDSFGRYAAPSGDQLGRGPLPPLVGEETKYWVFWNVRGTTNPLTNVRIEGDLGPGVRFTGKQTVSQNSSVTYDTADGSVHWSASRLESTLAPGSKIIGIGFELGITPTDAQVGKAPTLLSNVRITASDAITGAFVSTSGASVTTNLPNDALAAGLGIVER